VTERHGSEILYGPAVVLSLIDNSLVMFEDTISSLDKGRITFFQKVAQGKEKAPIEGQDVFRYLKETVLKNKPVS
jgi:hypothetical protein